LLVVLSSEKITAGVCIRVASEEATASRLILIAEQSAAGVGVRCTERGGLRLLLLLLLVTLTKQASTSIRVRATKETASRVCVGAKATRGVARGSEAAKRRLILLLLVGPKQTPAGACVGIGIAPEASSSASEKATSTARCAPKAPRRSCRACASKKSAACRLIRAKEPTASVCVAPEAASIGVGGAEASAGTEASTTCGSCIAAK
jgi:hypothetical protein